MDSEVAKQIVDHSDDCKLHESYSGKGMFGEETTGVVAPSFEEFVKSAIGATMTHSDTMDGIFDSSINSDSMGLDVIFY